jgi:hypothetical protein
LLTEKGQPPGEQKNLPMNQSGIRKQSLGAQKSNPHRQPRLKARDNRWKWMTTAAAGMAGGVAQSYAGMVTITLSNNFICASGGNHLNADLTGDGRPDLLISNVFYQFRSSPSISTFATKGKARVNLNGVHAYAYHSGHYPLGFERLGSKTARITAGSGTPSLNGAIPITFRDLHINNGVLTEGSLEVTVTNFGPHGPAEIDLDSLTYNTRNGVPDRGSSLSLLAIGAGGILALRRWRAAQGNL